MNEITDLREIQQVELGILRHLDQVCRENGLHFFLSNGTLLGAVKYEGFIPWDDDIDVFMPRYDYDRLMRLSGADSGPYRLLSQERTSGWRLPFAKLCDLSTCKQETCADFGADIGLDVDIFPLDAWSGGAAQARRCGLWRRGVSASIESRFLSPRTGWRRAALYLFWRLSRLLGCGFFCRRIRREAERGRALAAPAYLGCVVWSLYGGRELIPAEVFGSSVPVRFEGHTYCAPGGYDTYLRRLYGDYAPDPPPDKQVSHHHFRAWYR